MIVRYRSAQGKTSEQLLNPVLTNAGATGFQSLLCRAPGPMIHMKPVF